MPGRIIKSVAEEKRSIMKNDQYLKFEVCLMNTIPSVLLIDAMGMEGWGIYLTLLLRMRQDDNLLLSASKASIKAISKQCNTTPERMEAVIGDFGLFVLQGEGTDLYSSPYLDKIMAPLWARRGEKMPRMEPTAPTALKPAEDGQFTSASIEEQSIEEKSTEDQSKTEQNSNNRRKGQTAVVADNDTIVPIHSWEALVDEMAQCQEWMNLVGFRSGLKELFIEHSPRVVELFREHIRLYDKGGGLLRLEDVKRYFANYLSAGSRTCQTLRERLLQQLVQQRDCLRQQSGEIISAFETLVDGQRTYLGHLIPPEAPPRPDSYSVWDERTRKWGR